MSDNLCDDCRKWYTEHNFAIDKGTWCFHKYLEVKEKMLKRKLQTSKKKK